MHARHCSQGFVLKYLLVFASMSLWPSAALADCSTDSPSDCTYVPAGASVTLSTAAAAGAYTGASPLLGAEIIRALSIYSLVLAALFLCAVRPAFAAECNSDGTCHYVTPGSSAQITPSVAGQTFTPSCEQVTNSCTTDVVVPHATQEEWNGAADGFLGHIHNNLSCVTLASCGATCSNTITANKTWTNTTGSPVTVTYTLHGGGGGSAAGSYMVINYSFFASGAGGGGGGTTALQKNNAAVATAAGGGGGVPNNSAWSAKSAAGSNGSTTGPTTVTLAPNDTLTLIPGGGGGGGGIGDMPAFVNAPVSFTSIGYGVGGGGGGGAGYGGSGSNSSSGPNYVYYGCNSWDGTFFYDNSVSDCTVTYGGTIVSSTIYNVGGSPGSGNSGGAGGPGAGGGGNNNGSSGSTGGAWSAGGGSYSSGAGYYFSGGGGGGYGSGGGAGQMTQSTIAPSAWVWGNAGAADGSGNGGAAANQLYFSGPSGSFGCSFSSCSGFPTGALQPGNGGSGGGASFTYSASSCFIN